MERIQITENDHTYHMFFDGENFKVQVFDEEEIKNPFSFLKLFKPSPSTYLVGENTYYDPESKLYHKYHNGEEDYTYFFQKNGSPLLFGNNHTSKSSERRIFRIKNLILCCSLAGLLFASSCQAYGKEKLNYSTSDITVDYLKNAIESSIHLSDPEKQYLYNEDYLRDILPLMNQNSYYKWKNKRCFDNISIVGFPKEETSDILGFYQTNTPSTLYIRDYEGLTDENKNPISHEFTHLSQDTRGYNLILEACAEIISFEYFDKAQMKEYTEPVKLVKILMEMIGTKEIWEYNYNNNFKPIEEKIKPYLTEEEYQEFLEDLSFDTRHPDNNKEKYKSLYSLLEKIYKAMYHSDMKDNEVINLIRQNHPYLVRYYFNQRLIDKEPSYYYIPTEGSYEEISFEEAIEKKILTITAIDKRPVSYDEAMHLLESGETIEREIDTSNNFVTVLRRTDTGSKTTISCIVNHQRYDDVDLDELVKKGIVSVIYYHIYSTKECSYEEYQANSFNDTTRIYLSHPEDVMFKKNGIVCFIPTKIELPPVNQINTPIQYTKK